MPSATLKTQKESREKRGAAKRNEKLYSTTKKTEEEILSK